MVIDLIFVIVSFVFCVVFLVGSLGHFIKSKDYYLLLAVSFVLLGLTVVKMDKDSYTYNNVSQQAATKWEKGFIGSAKIWGTLHHDYPNALGMYFSKSPFQNVIIAHVLKPSGNTVNLYATTDSSLKKVLLAPVK
jgi:hypothetical protein